LARKKKGLHHLLLPLKGKGKKRGERNSTSPREGWISNPGRKKERRKGGAIFFHFKRKKREERPLLLLLLRRKRVGVTNRDGTKEKGGEGPPFQRRREKVRLFRREEGLIYFPPEKKRGDFPSPWRGCHSKKKRRNPPWEKKKGGFLFNPGEGKSGRKGRTFL